MSIRPCRGHAFAELSDNQWRRANPAPSAPVARHIERVESGFRELSATAPVRSPKSVPDTVSRSREFQVHIHPRARVDTVQDCPESWVLNFGKSYLRLRLLMAASVEPPGLGPFSPERPRTLRPFFS